MNSELSNKLEYLEDTKNAIKQAIVDKGVSVSENDTFRTYSQKIDSISSSSISAAQYLSIAPNTGENGVDNHLLGMLKKLDLSGISTTSPFTEYHLYASSYSSALAQNLEELNLSTFNTTKLNTFDAGDYWGLTTTTKTNIIWSNNWGPVLTKFDVRNLKISHDSCLDLFSKLAVRENSPVIQMNTDTKTQLDETEIAIATNKGWTIA